MNIYAQQFRTNARHFALFSLLFSRDWEKMRESNWGDARARARTHAPRTYTQNVDKQRHNRMNTKRFTNIANSVYLFDNFVFVFLSQSNPIPAQWMSFRLFCFVSFVFGCFRFSNRIFIAFWMHFPYHLALTSRINSGEMGTLLYIRT